MGGAASSSRGSKLKDTESKVERNAAPPKANNVKPPSEPAATEPTNPLSLKVIIIAPQHPHGQQVQHPRYDDVLLFAEKLASTHPFDVELMTEVSPSSLLSRARLVAWADAVVVTVCWAFQSNPPLMETLHYVADQKKHLIPVLFQPSFSPTGSLAALSFGSLPMKGGSFVDFSTADALGAAVTDLAQRLDQLPTTGRESSEKPALVDSREIVSSLPLESSSVAQILVLFNEDTFGRAGAALVKQGMQRYGVKGTSAVVSATPDTDSMVISCQVLVLVITKGFEENVACREAVEVGRKANKFIVPVMAQKGFWPSMWLSLAISGRLFHMLYSAAEAEKPVYDSKPLNDFVLSVNSGLLDAPSDQDIEDKQIQVTRAEVEKFKERLPQWPPPELPPESPPDSPRLPPPPPSNSKLPFDHMHYEVTRMTFKPPEPLFDARGVYLNRSYDFMFSYQWDIQQRVRDLYMDMGMRSLSGWMDIWGGMTGSIFKHMAQAVECSSVIVVFLTEAYLRSRNCNIEFKYALKRRKPMVVVMSEPDLQTKIDSEWIEAIRGKPQVEIHTYSEAGAKVDGTPKVDILSHYIRQLSGGPKSSVQVAAHSEELLQLMAMLERCKAFSAIVKGEERYLTCTRCSAQYEEEEKGGCSKHRAYYMGGNLMAGRWVCCRQQDAGSPGCEVADHINVPRAFVTDPAYGTKTWNPP